MYGSSTAATQTGHNFQGLPVLEKNAKNVHGMMVDIYFVTPQSLVYILEVQSRIQVHSYLNLPAANGSTSTEKDC